MGRGQDLSPEETEKVDVLHGEGNTQQRIAKIIKRSKTAVGNHLRGKRACKSPKKPEPRLKLSDTAKRAQVHRAQKAKLTAREVCEQTQVGV